MSNANWVMVFERHGGIGDQEFVLPIIKYFRQHEKYILNANGLPIKIVYSTQQKNWFLTENLQVNGKRLIDERVDLFPMWWKLPHKTIDDPAFIQQSKDNINKLPYKPDTIISFFESVERNDNANYTNVYDHHFNWAGIDPNTISPDDKLPIYSIRERESKDAEKVLKHCPGSNRFRIGIQMHSSSLPRTWDKNDKLILELAKKYPWAAIYSFGDVQAQILEPSPNERPRNYMPLSGKTRDGRLWGACIGGMDLMIGVDSGAMHIAGALKVPVIGIFSTVPGWTRIKYYKNSIGIDSSYPCAKNGCFHIGMTCPLSTPTVGRNFKPSLNIQGKNSSYPCLSSISVNDVLEAVEKFL